MNTKRISSTGVVARSLPFLSRHWGINGLLAGFLIVAAGSCTTPSRSGLSGANEPEERPFINEAKLETVVIVGTNDIHGALSPESFKTKDPSPVTYERGGAAIFARHLDILRDQFGSHLLWLDGGDEFQGSIDSNLEEGRPMVEFFNTLGLNAAAIGNHEFDFGPAGAGVDSPALRTKDADLRGALKARLGEAKYPYLAANIFEKKSGKPALPNTQPSVMLQAGKLKIGVIGLSTQETPTSTRPEYVRDLEFRDLAKTAQTESEKLRAQGANIVIAVAHSGVFCNFAERSGKAITAPMMKSERTLQSACDSKDELAKALRKMPKGTLDAVVSGHTHSLVHHWIEGIPVIQAGTRLNFYNLIYLTYDWDKKALVTDRGRIEGPIPVCPKIFENQGNCNGDLPAPAIGRGDLVDATFRGKKVAPESRVEAVLKPYFARTDEAKKRVVGKITQKIEHQRTEESPLGNLVSDAIRASVSADFAIINSGGIRSNLEAGDLRYEDVFRALPFDNFVSLLSLKGRELTRFIKIAESGARGYFPVSGLRLKVIDLNQEPWSADLDGNGKVEPWEMDRLISAVTETQAPIQPEKMYTVATIDFLVQGGDSMGWFMGQLPKERIQLVAGPIVRDAVIEYIARLGHPLNTEMQPLINPADPRIQKLNRPSKSGESAKGRKSRKKRRR